MPVKNYVSRNGQVEYEYDDLGDLLTYGRDALGNVVAGYDWAGNAVFTADYKPYGEFAAITGNVAGRRFMWVGSWGYRFTSGVPVSHYVRARHLSMRMGMWTSVDPLWPEEAAFGYVGGSPGRLVDPTGKWCYRIRPNQGPFEPKPQKFFDSTAQALKDLAADPAYQAFLECIDPCRPGHAQALGQTMGEQLLSWSSKGGKDCDPDFIVSRDTGGLGSPCGGRACAVTNFSKKPPLITICRRAHEDNRCGPLKCILAHELIHAMGHTHASTTVQQPDGTVAPYECVKKLKGCENFTAFHGQ